MQTRIRFIMGCTVVTYRDGQTAGYVAIRGDWRNRLDMVKLAATRSKGKLPDMVRVGVTR